MPVVFAIAALIAITVVSWAGKRMTAEARVARTLRAAPRVAIADLREGVATRLVGVVIPGPTVIAPLTGRPCVAYLVRVEEQVSRGKYSHPWVTRIVETRGVPFTIDDGTGQAIVDPERSTLSLEMDANTRSGMFDDATPVESEFLRRHGVSSKGWLMNKAIRYSEGVIEVGERVGVLGVGLREPDPGAAGKVTGYRDALPTRVRLGGSPDQAVIVTDRGDLNAG